MFSAFLFRHVYPPPPTDPVWEGGGLEDGGKGGGGGGQCVKEGLNAKAGNMASET